MPGRLPACLVAAAALAATAAPASAASPFDLPEQGTHPSLALGADGTGHVVYTDDPFAVDAAHYCRLPAGATACSHTATLKPPDGHVDDAFAVLDGATIRVVMPRYVEGDVFQWTAPAAGGPFTGPVEIAPNGSHTGETSSAVLLNPGGALTLASWNPLAYVQTIPPGTEVQLPDPSYAFDLDVAYVPGSGDQIAAGYSIPNSGDSTVAFWRNGAGPSTLGAGSEPELSGGPAGVFLTYRLERPGLGFSDRIAVRRLEGAGFGAARHVGREVGYFPQVFQAGDGDDALVYAMWRLNGSPNEVRLATSGDRARGFGKAGTIARDSRAVSHFEADAIADGTGWAVWAHISRAPITVLPLERVAVKPGKLVRFPKRRTACSRVKITLRVPGGRHGLSAQVRAGGKKVGSAKGGNLAQGIRARGLGEGRVKLKVAVRLDGGQVVKASRAYPGCG
jgi:hypothetical protein